MIQVCKVKIIETYYHHMINYYQYTIINKWFFMEYHFVNITRKKKHLQMFPSTANIEGEETFDLIINHLIILK